MIRFLPSYIWQYLTAGEEGQGLIEYGLLAALISDAALGVLTALGAGLLHDFKIISNAV